MRSKIFRLLLWLLPLLLLLLTIATLSDYMTRINMRLKALRVPASTESQPELRSEQLTIELSPPKPRTHLGFLKVHKAASTTTQAIFLRFGWRRNLTFVLPPEYNKFGYPNIISLNESVTKYNTLPPPPGKTFDILCHHVVYGEKAWDSILPSDTAIIGTVREPFKLFVSTLNYFNPVYIRRINVPDQIGEYLINHEKYDPRTLSTTFTNNRLAFEYGATIEMIRKKDVEAFETFTKNVLNKRFDVVIVAERFDESLVLMKRKLSWELNDIMYALKNVRSEKKPDNFKVGEIHRVLHKKMSPLDYIVYDFFEKRLAMQIAEEGPDFDEEVEYFKQSRKKVETFCHTLSRFMPSVTVHKSPWNEEFLISREDCNDMHKGEIGFTQEIRKRQYGAATWTFRRH